MKKIFFYLVFVSILSLFIFNALSATNGDKGNQRCFEQGDRDMH